MGVKGLSTFLSKYPELSERFELHDSLVVVDGNNLSHSLYSKKIDFVYGGDYEKYGNIVRKYFSVLLKCNITPIVIFDGGYEERKLKTLIIRAKDRLKRVQKIARGEKSSIVIPVMMHKVFVSVLIDLGIPFARSDYEADDQITALANYYNCPVISNDGDFFIFDVHCGFIRLDTLIMKIKQSVDSYGKKFFLVCNMYRIDKFVSLFPGLDKKVLPLLGSLIGNDYVEDQTLDGFFTERNISDSKQEKILDLLFWLQSITADNAFEEVKEYLERKNRKSMKCTIENSVNGYKLNNYSLSTIIDKKLNSVRMELPLYSRLSTRCGNPLPVEFVVRYHQGQLPRIFINAITHHRVFLRAQINNMDLLSSYVCSRYIRQILYGIIVRHDTGNGECQNECCRSYVEEYGRRGDVLDVETVEPIFSVEEFGMLPNINEIYNLQEEKCKEIISKVLGITTDFASNLPEEWQLYMVCINYWLRNSTSYALEAFTYAAVLCFLYFNLIKYRRVLSVKRACRNKTSSTWFTASNSARKNKFLSPSCTCSISCILSSVDKYHLNVAEKNFESYIKKQYFDANSIDIIHNYSELQTCVLHVMHLNDLLGNCMINPKPELCFNGTLLHSFTKSISTHSSPGKFAAEILVQGSNLHSLFVQLISTVYENVPNCDVLRSLSQGKKGKCPKNKGLVDNKVKSNVSVNRYDILSKSELL